MLVQVKMLFYLLLFNVISVSPSKLNVPRVLLPLFQQFSTNFTLEVSENGCYRWSSSRPDIVEVLPADIDEIHRCSMKAVVSAVTKEPMRNTVIVLAEEVRTGFILRCDVIVDTITSLSIVTTTRELFMEEAPEMFEVRAIDKQGNEFTTLEGIEFQWSIENVVQSSSTNQILRFITFIDSPYETPHTVEKFDALGLRGHMVLIEGVKTGSAKVSVKMPHAEYRDVSKEEVLLTVIANLLLNPSDAHILAGDTVKFKLLQMQHGRLDEVPLPSSQYSLGVEESEILALNKATSEVRGVRLGVSRVILQDRHSDTAVKLPSALVTVTEPAYLRLTLLPYNNWAVVVNEQCSIQVQLFDRNNHRIHIGDAVSIRTVVSKEFFQMHSMTRNGTLVDGSAIKVGTVPVSASLESIRAIGGKEIPFVPVISAHEEMLIYPRITVTPSRVIVPWDSSLTKYEYKLFAEGGDGTYNWRSINVSVATVGQSGLVKCHRLGETSVVVSMTRNPAISATSHISVLPPSHIEILKHVLEAPVLKPIILHIVLYADTEDEFGNLQRVPITHCQDVQFKVEIANENFFRNITDKTMPLGKACATVAIFGKVLGTSQVKISHKVNDIVLEATTEVAAFSPLDVIHPEKKVTVLAVGTSRHIVWKGGPRIWLGKLAEHTRSVSSSSNCVEVEEVPFTSPNEFYVYSVFCRKLGESTVVLTVKNTAGNGKQSHIESVASVKVICAKPRFIAISPETAVNSSCPYSSDSSKIVALSYEPIHLIVTVSDCLGRVFDNATSFLVEWSLSSKSLGYVQFDWTVALEEMKEYNYIVPLYHYQTIYPKNIPGTLVVEAVVANYRMQMLTSLRITPEQPVFGVENDAGNLVKPEIKTSLTIVLVDVAVITPDRASVFNHPNNKVLLKVTQGSGFYKIYQNSLDIAEVKYLDSSRSVEVVPKSDGLLQLTLLDLCLTYDSPIVEVQVLKVGSLQVEMVDRVQKGDTVTATVWLYDTVDNALAVANSELLELRTHVDAQLVSVARAARDAKDSQVTFNITGVELGTTTITFISGYGEREISSQPMPIQVFPPLRLIPQEVTLTPGAIFQVTATGGPQPDCAMEFVSSDAAIAKVTGSGLVEAQRVGDMSVTGMAVGSVKATGAKVIYSQDQVRVKVIPLDGVKIHSPLAKLKVGCRMPLWASGVPDKLGPLVLGSIQPSVLFKWSVSVPDVIELQDVFHATGIEVPERDRLSVRVLGLRPGRVTIHLSATLRLTRDRPLELVDQIELEVFEGLRLVKPPLPAATMLIAPFTHTHLRTNMDSISEVTYSVMGAPEPKWAVGQNTALSSHPPVVGVSRAGLVTAHSALGTATVLIQSNEGYLHQTLPVNIQVKPVHYIMINVRTKLHLGSDKVIRALPRGLDLDLFISYHDNTGEEFTATRTDLRLSQNRYDIVKAVRGEVNGTVITKLVSYGPSVLKIWDKSTPKLSGDYMKLRVDHLITPSKRELTVGDVACFSLPLLDASGASGQWGSGSPEVISMESAEGLARALRPGQALIKYSLDNTITTSTLVEVFPIQSMVFLSLNGRNLTNWGSFSAPLLLMSERDGSDKTSNLLADHGCPVSPASPLPHAMPFSCEIRFNSPLAPVDIHHVFHVQPTFSIETGLYSCQFEALSAPSSNTSLLCSNVTLRAIKDNMVSESLVIPFLPAVFLPTNRLSLNDKQTWSMLPIVGLPPVLAHVQVLSSDASFVTVELSRKPDTTTVLYQVSLGKMAASQPDRQLYVYVVSPLTGQNITVPVQFNLRGRLSAACLAQPAAQWYQEITDWGPFTSIVSIFVILFVMWYSNMFNWMRSGYATPSVYATSTPTSTLVYGNGSSPHLADSRSFLYRQPFSDSEPVYGDPNLTHSPELNRRNRR